jgi:hypothetical protein
MLEAIAFADSQIIRARRELQKMEIETDDGTKTIDHDVDDVRNLGDELT